MTIRDIAVLGPVSMHDFADLLDTDQALPRGGGEQVTLLCRALHERGYHIHVVTLNDEVPGETIHRGERISLHACNNRAQGRARDLYAVERGFLERSLRKVRADVVHAHWTHEYALAALSVSVAPTLITVRDWAPAILRAQPNLYRVVRLIMQRMVLSRGRQFTVTSPYMLGRVRSLRRRDVTLIPNGIPDARFTGAYREARQRQDLIAVNNGWSPLKNVGTLLVAFQQLRKAIPGARLKLVGQDYGSDGPASHWARSKGMSSSVEFVGRVSHDDVFQLLHEADLLVHPAIEESFGNTLIESMATGTPVIGGTRSGAVPWVLDHGRAGVLADVMRPDDLEKAMKEVLCVKKRWLQLSRQGYEHAWSNFRLSAIVSMYLKRYEAMLNRQVENLGS